MENVVKIVHSNHILVKYEKMVLEFDRLTDRMKAMVLYLTHFMTGNLNIVPIWTCFYRPPQKIPTVHTFFRGADTSKRVIDLKYAISMRNVTKQEVDIICYMMEKTFPYGKKGLKSCIFHNVRNRPHHFHCQSKI